MENECIGDQGPMAAPRHRLCAHDRSCSVPAICQKLFKGFVKFFCLHVVGVSAKIVIMPSSVDGILPWLSQPAQPWQVAIREPGIAQGLGQRLRIELGIVAGSGNGADIDEMTDLMGTQQTDEFIDRSGRVADGPDCRSPRHGAVWHRSQGFATGWRGGGSIRRHFFRIDFEQPQSAVGDVFGLVEAIAYLQGSDQESTACDKCEVTP